VSRRQNGAGVIGVALLVAVTAISFAAIFFRKASPTPPLVSAGIRLLIACVLLTPMAIRSWTQGRSSRRLVSAGCFAGLFYGIHFGAWVWSLSLTTVAASVTLVTSTPLLLAVVALVTGRDRPDRRLWAAVGLATIGILIVGGSDWNLSATALLGDGLALLGAAGMAGYLLLARRLGKSLDIWIFSALATGVGAVATLTSAAAAGMPIRPASSEALLFLVLAAVIPQLVGHTILTWAVQHTRPVVVGMATVGEPVGATILAFLWLGESPTLVVVLGCVVVLASVALAIVSMAKEADATHPN